MNQHRIKQPDQTAHPRHHCIRIVKTISDIQKNNAYEEYTTLHKRCKVYILHEIFCVPVFFPLFGLYNASIYGTLRKK